MFRLQAFAESFRNAVFLNNKQMIYNPKSELFEQKRFDDTSTNTNLKWKPVKLVEKSNIFKNSFFVTKSNFNGGSNKVNSGTYNSSAFNWFMPTRKHLTNINHLVTKRPLVHLPSTQLLVQAFHTFDTTTGKPVTILNSHELNDEITSIQNSLVNINEEIFKDHLEKDPTTDDAKPVESTYEKPLDFSSSTSTPTTGSPALAVHVHHTKKKRKKKGKKRRKFSTTNSSLDNEGFMQNANNNRKIRVPNFPKKETKKYQENLDVVTKKGVVEFTPKDENSLVGSKLKINVHNTAGKKHKKDCKKKRGERDHSSESHKDDKNSKEADMYFDTKGSNEYDYVGNLFSTFYSFFEDALTSKEIVRYGKDVSNSESEDYEDYRHRRLKRENAVDPLKSRVKKDDPLESRKTVTTKITVTNEYDDPVIIQTTTPKQSHIDHSDDLFTKKPSERPIIMSSEESEELTFYDNIIGTSDYDDESSDEENEIDSYEYYDEPAENRLPDEGVTRESLEDYSDENDAPSFSFFDGISSMFSKIGNFLSSFTGMGDPSRAPPSEDDYDDEGRSTTEKAEQQSKRPKRENEHSPWYQPSFLFSDDNDDEKASSSTTHRNWLQSPWQQNDDDENEIATQTPFTTTEDSTPTKTSAEPSYNFMDLVTQYISPRKRMSVKSKAKKLLRKKYDDYELWRISPRTKDDMKTIDEFKMSIEGRQVHWLKGPSSRGISDVVVPPEYVTDFKDFLSDNDINFDVKVRDIQHAIQFENPRLNKRDQIELEVIHGHPLTWYRYHPYKDIQSYYDYLKRKFPKYTELIQLGWTYEGRPLTIVKVSHPRVNDATKLLKEHRSGLNKPAIVIQSGLEAHEWLPIACSTYILDKLVSNIEGNDTLGEMIRKVDWYIMPVVNPDGYDFSIHYDRLWQKTRSKHLPSTDMWASA